MKKVALGLSGGVDSAVSAYLLKKQGFDVSCIYLNCFDPFQRDDSRIISGCRRDQDRKDALAVALHLSLPFQVLDFRKEYQAAVIDYFKKEYLSGRTPNPDVVCNRDIKFGLLLDWCIKNGFDYLATGHYADGPDFSERKIVGTPAPRSRALRLRGRRPRDEVSVLRSANPVLRIPKDLHKDQTYFLWAVPRQRLEQILFPLGDLLKSEVREIARKAKLPVAEKKDSTGICFVGEVGVEDFLKRLGVKEKEGEVVVRNERRTLNVDQRITYNAQRTTYNAQRSTYSVIGRHRGVWFYTIGQRHGFEIIQWPIIGFQSSVVSSKSVLRSKILLCRTSFQFASLLRPINRKQINQKPKTDNPARLRMDDLSDQTSSVRSQAGVQAGGRKPTTDRPPLYIIEKDIKNNRLIVGFGAECYRDSFEVSDCNWLIDDKTISNITKKARPFPKRPGLSKFACLVRIRHGGDLIPCSVIGSPLSVFSFLPADATRQALQAGKSICYPPAGGKQENQNPTTVLLASPQRGIAAGQSAVFYDKTGIVLGGGVIQ